MKVNLSHCIKQVAGQMPTHGVVLEQFEAHLREVIQGEHTLQELAETYCMATPQGAEIIDQRSTQIGGVTVTTTVGRVNPRR